MINGDANSKKQDKVLANPNVTPIKFGAISGIAGIWPPTPKPEKNMTRIKQITIRLG